MGRPPSNGAPAFRFNAVEVAQMEAVLREHDGQVPARELLVALADKFSNSPERSGKVTVQMKQVWNWFQNRRYALRSKLVKSPGNLYVSPLPRDEVPPVRNVLPVPQQITVPSGHNVVRNTSETPPMEFEAKSARDGAWYDVQGFLSHRYLETGNPEVLVRFAGFGPEEDEWVNVRKHVRQRSLPCESSECVALLPGDLILCFQEGKEQALYFDAHVLDAQRRRHDVRGCRCRFLVRYDHDQSEEIVPLRKVCRRPETDYRLQQLHASNESASASADTQRPLPVVDPTSSGSLRLPNPNPNPGTSSITVLPPANVGPPPPAPAPAPVPALGQEPKMVEINEPKTDIINNVGVGTIVPEPEKAESSHPETSKLIETTHTEESTSGNPIKTVPGAEKVESSSPGHPPLADSAPAVASTVTLSTENIKE